MPIFYVTCFVDRSECILTFTPKKLFTWKTLEISRWFVALISTTFYIFRTSKVGTLVKTSIDIFIGIVVGTTVEMCGCTHLIQVLRLSRANCKG